MIKINEVNLKKYLSNTANNNMSELIIFYFYHIVLRNELSKFIYLLIKGHKMNF